MTPIQVHFRRVEGVALFHMDNLTRLLFQAFDTHYISACHMNKDTVNATKTGETEDAWTFLTAIFFTSTLLTTIGRY